ncbi:hypothetical protein LN042_28675 [Kitasatospora sp. RB6PN24]|uniref:hypothetical protein n=1 Tax=Kitasatospora humi TaxID=2893891 RepID=UPI001E575201|nr:hypothetical protein [Kitasatospora humi]MCC9310996.1 hypothetical protein [Kitasatospora humi]
MLRPSIRSDYPWETPPTAQVQVTLRYALLLAVLLTGAAWAPLLIAARGKPAAVDPSA